MDSVEFVFDDYGIQADERCKRCGALYSCRCGSGKLYVTENLLTGLDACPEGLRWFRENGYSCVYWKELWEDSPDPLWKIWFATRIRPETYQPVADDYIAADQGSRQLFMDILYLMMLFADESGHMEELYWRLAGE